MKPYSKYFEKIRIRPDPQAEAKTRAPSCQWDGCQEAGLHRAPVGRHREGEYFRFCVDHAREYNKNYNYFSGLNDGEVARYQKEALTGHRPTWKFTGGSAAKAAADYSTLRSGRAGYHNRMGDPFNLFGGRRETEQSRQRRLKPLEAKALETLGLGAQATGAEIKARYKSLVKRHHPDANGGDRGSEDRLRSVLEAYRLLKQAGLC
ncbi:J domain-containing protein [Nitratireductor pacificus]|uniref:Heat shock protein DnaJ-like protein n=1 Tax=Nitratireductor pacificus pht-3B TaxID=391937 RepID=K2M8C2_9HYPH|nr:DnaJ domain-containing protein [Nitratireductor pacificus]EKF17180.1 heat shock protein DnaJ-like protein [Nitratireductor pacificus pht-3B]